MDKRVFKRTEVDPNRRPGWVVDLSPENGPVNPDCYWYFPTRKSALAFLALVDDGMRPDEAQYRVQEAQASVSGTPPDTSIYLGPERRAWLKAQGGIQPTIHRLVDQARQGECHE